MFRGATTRRIEHPKMQSAVTSSKKSCRSASYAYNKIDTTLPKNVVTAAMVQQGLTVHVQCSRRVKNSAALVKIFKSFKISITEDIAETLFNLLLEEPSAVIDLKSTELYKNPQTWQKLALTRPIQKQMWLIIQQSSSDEFTEDIDAISKVKDALFVSGIIITCVILVGFPLLIAGAALKKVTPSFKWERIFDSEPAQLTTEHMLLIRCK